MASSDLAHTVLTKTSIVRQMAKKTIGNQKITKRNGRKMTLGFAMERLSLDQLPHSYTQYCLRKASFRGGFTFTSGIASMQVLRNVASLDVTSMHHTFINGRMVPVHFRKIAPDILERFFNSVVSADISDVLSRYDKPFEQAFHMKVRFSGLRLKRGSAFEAWQIALIASGKFRKTTSHDSEHDINERAREAEHNTRSQGWYDSAVNPVFAFGKLYTADECVLHLSELELWCISRVYEWVSHACILGEGTIKFIVPPDYVTLQSNVLFETKNDVKIINNNYQEGKPYGLDIPATIPDSIRNGLLTGSLEKSFLTSYYNSTIKGMFNGIYGTQAQDIYKPDYAVEQGELYVNKETTVIPATWRDSQPKNTKVFYNYGLRIVGGSRMHLIIGIELLYKAFGERVTITGGDTDSLKIRCDEDITDEQLLSALAPLHKAARVAIKKTTARIHRLFPGKASRLNKVGEFDIEDCGGSTRWDYHMECWNKARVSISSGNEVHVTCAGLSRPAGSYHIEQFISDMIAAGHTPEEILPQVIGYNVYVSNEISHGLEHHRPRADDIYEQPVTDYNGVRARVREYESVALYPMGRYLGDTLKRTNSDTVSWMKNNGLEVITAERNLEVKDGKPVITDIEGVVLYE